MRHLTLMRARLSMACAIAALPSCGDDPSGDDDAGADADTATDSDSGGEVEPNDFVESHAPLSPPPVRLNRKIAVVFVPSSQAADFVLPQSVAAEIDGEASLLFPYYREANGNREFRFVPFPLWTPGSEITVRIFEGVTYDGSGESMVGDFAWTFSVEDTPFAEAYDPLSTAALTADELDLSAAGGAVFQPANVVGEWQDPESTLYLVSEPADPADQDLLALAVKLRDSLVSVGGIGLAAPQIGINRRLFGARLAGRPAAAYVNPLIVDWSADQVYYWQNGLGGEGCLSIGGVSAKVARPRWIVVDYYTEDGILVQDDYLETNAAVTFLHEYDHLNGILITDRQEQK
jgi:peptide deformylase